DAGQRFAEHTGNVLEIEELDDLGGHRPAGVLAETEHLGRDALLSEPFEGLTERLPVGGGHHDTGETLPVPQLDVAQHVGVDIAVLVDLRLGEHREAHITQGLDPGADDVRAAGCDVGEHRGLGFEGGGVQTRQFGGAPEQPPAESVEARTVGGGGPAAEDRAEAHVEVGGVPDEQDLTDRLDAVDSRGVGHAGKLFMDTHAPIFPQTNSLIALPTWCALSSNLVTGRSRLIGAVPVKRARRGSSSPTSAMASAYSAWSVATCSTPPGFKRSAIRANVGACRS